VGGIGTPRTYYYHDRLRTAFQHVLDHDRQVSDEDADGFSR